MFSYLKKLAFFIFFMSIFSFGFIRFDQACSLVKWANNGMAVIVGRTLDWADNLGTNLWVFPRGIERNGLVAENPLQWKSKYGSLIASAYDVGTADGMNEKGLSAHMLWLTEADFGVRNPKLPGLAVSLWPQYFLDNFSSVNEAISYFEKNEFQPVTATFGPKKVTALVHLALEDASGDSAVIEYTNGKPKIWHGKEYAVMTNSPPYEVQLKNLKQYKGFGGSKPLPGAGSPGDRYVRAAYYLKHLPKPETTRQMIAEIFSVIRNVSQPFGLSEDGALYSSPTYWRTVSDLTDQVYYFESTMSPYLIWVNLKELNFKEGAPVLKLDLVNHLDRLGDVTKEFAPTKAFEFAKP